MLKRAVFTCSALILLLVLTGILTAEDTVTYTADIKPVLTSNGCTGCHSYTNTYSALLNQTSSSTQSGLPLVNTVAPDSSVILWRLLGEKSNGDPVSRMPQGGAALSTETIALFRTWIEQGAPDDVIVDVEENKSWREIKEQYKED